MANELTIKSVMQQANCYNLAIPFVQGQQNPFYKTVVSLVPIDTRAGSAEIFKVSSQKVNNQWVENYALTKPALMKMATEAGIQFDPSSADVIPIDANKWKATVCGAIKLPDGTVRTSVNSKVIDLLSEEKKYRSGYKQEAASGITDEKKINKISKKYHGTFDNGVFTLDPSEKERYIEEQTNEAMSQLRANAPQKAITGANLRVIRDLLGIHGTYTLDELKKPFAIARAVFSPDYSDPAIKQMMLQQAMQSSTNLFGRAPQIQMQQPVYQQAAQISQEDNLPDMAIDTGIDDVVVEDAGSVPYSKPEVIKPPAQQEECRYTDQPVQQAQPMPRSKYQCEQCANDITEAEFNYSKRRFGRCLCRNCQNIAKGSYGTNR